MTPRLRFLLPFCVLHLAVCGAGCGDARSHTLRMAREVGFNELRADLMLVAAVNEQREIPKAVWPESIRRLHPLAVQRHMGGILLVARRDENKQEGTLFMLNPEDDPGAGGSGVGYASLRIRGVFWCVEKNRDSQAPLPRRAKD